MPLMCEMMRQICWMRCERYVWRVFDLCKLTRPRLTTRTRPTMLRIWRWLENMSVSVAQLLTGCLSHRWPPIVPMLQMMLRISSSLVYVSKERPRIEGMSTDLLIPEILKQQKMLNSLS